MSESCIFCQIVRNEAPNSRICEDDNTVAFLSNRPVNPGHVLVVPKRHSENIYQITDQEMANLCVVVKKVAQAVSKAIGPEGIRIVQNNGEAAGQVISHLHVHVIPMYSRLTAYHGNLRDIQKLDADAERIRRFI